MYMRDNYYSFLKGLAIIGVVFIHTGYSGCVSGASAVFIRQVFTFPVGLFIFLSGYFATKFDAASVKKSVVRLLVPYAIWSIFWFLETTLRATQPVDIWKIVNSFFFGGAFFPLYFLVVLAALRAVSPLLHKHMETHYNLKESESAEHYGLKMLSDMVLWISPLTIAAFYFIWISTQERPLVQEPIFLAWIIYYYSGILYRKGIIKISSISCVALVLVGLYLTNIESAYLLDNFGLNLFAGSFIKFSCVVYTLALSVLMMNCHKPMSLNAIVKLGEYSFGIYLLHIPVKKYLLEIPLANIGFHSIAYQVLVVILALILSYLIVVLGNKLLPQRISRYLGLS